MLISHRLEGLEQQELRAQTSTRGPTSKNCIANISSPAYGLILLAAGPHRLIASSDTTGFAAA